MKFSTVATVFAISSLAVANKGPKDDSTPTTVTSYVTQTTHRYGRFNKTSREKKAEETGTHKYGRFNKTKKVRTTTVLVSDETEIPTQNREVIYNKDSNSSSNSTSSTANGAMTVGTSLGFAGAIAVGVALVL